LCRLDLRRWVSVGPAFFGKDFRAEFDFHGICAIVQCCKRFMAAVGPEGPHGGRNLWLCK